MQIRVTLEQQLTTQYRINGSAEHPLCWKKVQEELPKAVLTYLLDPENNYYGR